MAQRYSCWDARRMLSMPIAALRSRRPRLVRVSSPCTSPLLALLGSLLATAVRAQKCPAGTEDLMGNVS